MATATVERQAMRWMVTPGAAVDLAEVNTRSREGAGPRAEAEASFPALRDRLRNVQERLWAEHRQSLLVVLQAIDAGGKDGTAKHLFRGLNPAGSRVVAFRAPTEEELEHDFLWRVHRHVPGKGEVVVFNRSHYEDVLVVRVQKLVPEEVWRPRYELINQFERLLATSGTRVVKIFLHISAREQAARFRARLSDPEKCWKYRAGDLEDRARWEEFQLAFGDAISHTSTEEAPWYVVPADRKWYRNWAVSHIVVETLEAMAPRYPPCGELASVVGQLES